MNLRKGAKVNVKLGIERGLRTNGTIVSGPHPRPSDPGERQFILGPYYVVKAGRSRMQCTARFIRKGWMPNG